MKVMTHIVGEYLLCGVCLRVIPDLIQEGKRIPLFVGDRVGVIKGLRYSEDLTYRIGEHDSNQMCEGKR